MHNTRSYLPYITYAQPLPGNNKTLRTCTASLKSQLPTQKSKQMYRPLEPTGLLPQSGSSSKTNKSVETCQKHWRRSPRSRPFTIVNAEPTRAAAPHLYVSWVDISQLSISSSPTFFLKIFFPKFIQTRYVGQQHIPCIIN